MLTVTPFLWLQHPVAEAVQFYTSVFDDAEVLAGPDVSDAMQTATIVLAGQTVHLFNAGSMRELTEAFSLMVTCSDQQEIDRLWDAFCEGGTPTQCGWVTDRFGITWQVVPDRLGEWLSDPEHGQDVMAAMLSMVKLEIAPLTAALRGQ